MISATEKKICDAVYLGIVPYEHALRMQQRLRQARADGSVPDTLLLLQHPPVFTTGRFRGDKDIIASPEKLQQEGITVFSADRGGSVTCHSPGQLVGYPVINLKENGLGVREYIWRLEEVIIRLLRTLGIEGQRPEKYHGSVWINGKKICSIGIHVSRHITTHGFALNVSNDLRYFDFIKPCGLDSNVMTSLSEQLGYNVEMESISGQLVRAFSEIFALRCQQGNEKCLTTPDALSG